MWCVQCSKSKRVLLQPEPKYAADIGSGGLVDTDNVSKSVKSVNVINFPQFIWICFKRGPQYWEILNPRLWCSPVLLTCQSCDWHEVFYCRQNFTCLNCVCIKIMNHCTTLPTQKTGLKPGYVNGFYSLLHSCSETRARDRASWWNPVSIQYAPEKFNTHWTEFYPDAAQWKARQNCTDFWCRYQTQRLGPHWALFVTTHPSVSLFSMTKFLSIIKVFPFLITQSVYFHFLLFVLFFVCLFSTVLRRDLFWCIVTKYWLWTKRRRFRILTL